MEENMIEIDGKSVKLNDLIKEFKELKKKDTCKAQKRYDQEKELKPFQAELLRLQQYLTKNF